MGKRILIVAGDPSGDHQGARFVEALRRRLPDAELFGLGGAELRGAGVRIDDDLVALSAIGLWDVAKVYLPAVAMLKRLRERVAADPPDAAVLIDCGAFNLRLGRLLKPLGVPVLGYFPPGSWSGSVRRARAVAEAYTTAATPFPQPLAAYRALGFPGEFVGHPLVEELAPLAAARRELALSPPTLALLPGSRGQEIAHLLRPLLDAAALLRRQIPELEVVVSRAPSAPRAMFDRILSASGVALDVVEGGREALARATAAIVKSGTIALEAGLVGVPMVVVYRVAALAWLLAGLYYWPRPKYWAMPNVLANDYVVPQAFQYRVNGPNLVRHVAPLLTDTPARREMTARLAELSGKLAGGDAPGRAAEMLLQLLSPGSSGLA